MNEIEENSPRLMSIRSAGSFLGISHWSIRSLIWEGELPFVRIGRAHMLDRDDLLRWVASRKEVAGTRKGPNGPARSMQSNTRQR